MHNAQKITDDLYYIGCNDRRISLFESIYPVPDGVSYNSYLLMDDKTILFDTVDRCFSAQFFENLNAILGDKKLNYFVINHLEPDHSALIKDVLDRHPNVQIVCNKKTRSMLYQFFEFENDIRCNFHIVEEGDILETEHHKFTFLMAPMVHWPEVMVTYDLNTKTLFSADAFGSFGALSGNLFDSDIEFNSLISEYRRYYTNIVGKYGPQVKALLNKAANVKIDLICPLHGLIIKDNISKIVEKYNIWADYSYEYKSALIIYSSVYGATQNIAEVVASKLAQNGIKNIKLMDISRVHNSYAIAETFKYSHIIIASNTYNNGIFVTMQDYLNNVLAHNIQNRTYAIIENGSWTCTCGKLIKDKLSLIKTSKFIENSVAIKSTIKPDDKESIDKLIEEITTSINK